MRMRMRKKIGTKKKVIWMKRMMKRKARKMCNILTK